MLQHVVDLLVPQRFETFQHVAPPAGRWSEVVATLAQEEWREYLLVRIQQQVRPRNSSTLD